MIADVEEKVFEFGMLRALGFDTRNIVTTISMQALIFSLPGLLNGIVFSAGLNYAFRSLFFSLTNNYASYWLPTKAVIIGGLLGLIMP
jgi:ABC-type lipoprotein release transport system permease subunit